ncbi:hypothetical protein ACFPIJ_42095 [Dactylosporangium cerinum]|uniref:Uncharacterized protein n=1 Tax=Dactylosporangium cerinum TaxID=1434730 RepID=A0ABV9W6U1_9ACTN
MAAVGLAPASAAIIAVAGGGTAQASTQLCDKYGSTVVRDPLRRHEQPLGADTPQCLSVTGTGFAVTADHHRPTNGAPASYTAVHYSCHYGNCSPGTDLPMRIGRSAVPATVCASPTPSGGTHSVSYAIWLDPAPNTQVVSKQELMIWFAKRGPIRPVGAKVATATVDGGAWNVWFGFNGTSYVVAYVARSSITMWSFDVRGFITNVKKRSKVIDA